MDGGILVAPVTVDRLDDLEQFSLAHGTFRYCSCMKWRLPSTEYKKASKAERVATLEGMVREGTPVGVLAYAGTTPVGWCSVAPRTTLRALERYKALPRIDDIDVWSVACFFVDRAHRSGPVSVELLRGATRYAQEQGASVVEGYPVPKGALYGYMGSPDVFLAAGFADVTPPGRDRVVMRWEPG